MSFRLLSDAMEELCSARTQEDVVRISAMLAKKASAADNLSVVMTSGEQFYFAPGSAPGAVLQSVCSKMITRISAWTLEAQRTAVVPDVHRDDRIRSHTNGSTFARSLVVVPVGRPAPFAAITFAWGQEHWPAASDVLLLEALARATGLALTCRPGHAHAAQTHERGTLGEWLGSAALAEGLAGEEHRPWLVAAELRHRMRNLLGVIRSLVRRTAETAASAEEYSAHLEGRINAIARTQALVMRHACTGVDLEELIDAELIAHAAREARVESAGPPVWLRPKAAETLALALHELVTNAVKYGALASAQGRIIVTWRTELDQEDPCVRLEWSETGMAAGVRPPRHRGFGRELIERTVPYELRGTTRLAFEPNRVHCIIEIPLSPDNVIMDGVAAGE